MDIHSEIEKTKAELERTRPRAMRRTVLEMRLRELRLKQLRSEIRIKRRRAA